MSSCEFGSIEFDNVGGNNIVFDGQVGNSHNPVRFPFGRWPVICFCFVSIVQTVCRKERIIHEIVSYFRNSKCVRVCSLVDRYFYYVYTVNRLKSFSLYI